MDKKIVVPVVFFLLLVLMGTQLVLSERGKAPIIDEVGFLRAHYLLETGTMWVIGHPPLGQFIKVPFLALADINLPENHAELTSENHYMTLTYDLLFHTGNDAGRILFLARIPIIIVSILFGVFIFKLAKDMYGVKAGLFALFLYTFSPVILSLGNVTTTDMVASFFMFLALYAYWNMLKKMTVWRVALTGLMFAFAITTRFPSGILVPIFFILGVTYYYEKKTLPVKKLAGSFIAIMFIGFLTISILYGFSGSFKSLGQNIQDDPAAYVDQDKYNAETISGMIAGDSPLRGVVKFGIDKVPIIVPYPLLKDMFSNLAQSKNNPSTFYVLGKFSHWFWYYFPLTFLVKMHFLILGTMALSIIFFKKLRTSMTAELLLILPFTYIFLFFVFFIQIESGIRYLMPVLPLLFVFVSKVVNLRSRIVAIPLVVLSSLYVISALMIFPNYDSYFNEIAGGPENGYKMLAGGNVELTGVNMIKVKEYMDEKNIDKIKLSYGGLGDPDYYGINQDNLQSTYLSYRPEFTLDCGPTTGVIIIYKPNLIGIHLENRSCFHWLQEYEPIDNIGHALFVYNITEN